MESPDETQEYVAKLTYLEFANEDAARRVADKLRFDVLLAGAACAAGAAGADQGNASEQFTYLQTHSKQLTDEVGRDLPEARVYLIGESHGVRALLMEMPYSASVLLQKYLNTGDRSILDAVFEQMQGTLAFARARKQFWRNIQRWNSGLAESEQIRVYGIDIEHQLEHSTAHLHAL